MSSSMAHPLTSNDSVSPLMSEEPNRELIPNSESMGRNCDSSLETLPPEIRRHLLSTLELPGLKALVRSSPIFHQQYLFDRHYLLCHSLESTLGILAVDAYTISGFAGNDELALLKSYSEETWRRPMPLVGQLTENAAIGMAAFYLRYVKPITERFGRWALDNLAREVGQDVKGNEKETTPSHTEMMRLTRATYHFQLLSQLVNPDDWTKRHNAESSIEVLFDSIQPWATEELLAFYEFAEEIYNGIFNRIRWDVHPQNPRFMDQGRPPTPDGAFDLINSRERQQYLEGTILRGLPLLHTVLFEIENHDHLISVMQQNITSSYIPFTPLEGVLGETCQILRLRDDPSPRDLLQEERAPLPFPGDEEAYGPPLAWTLIWNETHSSLYGYYIPDGMGRWGYVFWDAPRLERTGATDVLERQWQECWDFGDPRDDLY